MLRPKPTVATHPVKIKLGQTAVEAMLRVGNFDITSLVQKVEVSARVNEPTKVSFHLTHLGREGDIEIESEMLVEIISKDGRRFILKEIK